MYLHIFVCLALQNDIPEYNLADDADTTLECV